MATVVPDSVGSASVEPTDSKLVQEKGAAAATHATHELCAEVFEVSSAIQYSYRRALLLMCRREHGSSNHRRKCIPFHCLFT